MSISGQKSEASIRSYARNVSENTRRDMSLTQSIHIMSATYILQETLISESDTTATAALSDLELDCLDIPEIPSINTLSYNFMSCNVNTTMPNF